MFKKKREYIPIMYYKTAKPVGEVLKEEDFPMDYMGKLSLIARRLQDLGHIDNNRFMFYSLPKMMDAMEKVGILSLHFPFKELDTVGIVFGRNYANCWHRPEEGEDYLIPMQLVFFHEKKAETYFLSAIPITNYFKEDATDVDFVLDLCSVKTKYTNTDEASIIAANAIPPKMNTFLFNEIKTAYHLTFSYLKFFLLSKKSSLGYKDFITWLTSSLRNSEDIKLELTQYFSINAKSFAATHDVSFEDLIITEIAFHEDGLALWNSSPIEIENWIKRHQGDFEAESAIKHSLDETGSLSRLQVLREFKEKWMDQGLALWTIRKENSDSSLVLFLLKKGTKVENGLITSTQGESIPIPKSLHIEEYGGELMKRQEYLLEIERENRELAKSLYPLIGIHDIEETMQNISGLSVLAPYLYRENYIICLDAGEDEVHFALARLLEANGLTTLAEIIENTDIPLEDRPESPKTEDKSQPQMNPLQRMMAYAPLLKKRGKLLCHLDLFDDDYHFILLDNKPEIQERIHNILKKIEEIGDHHFLQI